MSGEVEALDEVSYLEWLVVLSSDAGDDPWPAGPVVSTCYQLAGGGAVHVKPGCRCPR